MQLVNSLIIAWHRHWPHYVAEALGLSFFVGCSGLLTMLVQHPASSVHQALPDSALLRRAVLGVAMGLVLVLIAYSPRGKRSGALINPAVTLAFWQLGKIRSADAAWYVMAQLLGAISTALLLKYTFGALYSHPAVNYNVTQPPAPTLQAAAVAFVAEFVISFFMMLLMLRALYSAYLKDWTGWLLGILLAFYICFETPLSGMSLNAARTLGTAVAAGSYHGLWLYWVAPGLAMWLATVLFRRYQQSLPSVSSVEPPQFPTDPPT